MINVYFKEIFILQHLYSGEYLEGTLIVQQNINLNDIVFPY